MKILFIVPYTPNLVRVRPYNLIRHLSKLGHQITVLTLTTGPKEILDVSAIEEICSQIIALPISRLRSIWNCISVLPTQQPLQSVYSWLPALSEEMQALVNGQDGKPGFDVIHVEHLRGARYGLEAIRHKRGNSKVLPVVWDSVDSISLLFRQAAENSSSILSRWVTRFELDRTEKYEAWLLNQFSNVLVTSRADQEALEELSLPGKRVAEINVLPNGVDLEYFKPDHSVAREPETIVVSGKMSYHANVSMVLNLAQEIMPLVLAKRPDTKLIVVGKDPPLVIRQLAQNPAIEVTGTVPDIRLYLRKATVAVAPIVYGAGIQNKILEAMACGTPVIAASQAINALNTEIDHDILVADTSEEFTGKIIQLLSDHSCQENLSDNGRSYVESFHNWETIANNLVNIYISAKNKTV